MSRRVKPVRESGSVGRARPSRSKLNFELQRVAGTPAARTAPVALALAHGGDVVALQREPAAIVAVGARRVEVDESPLSGIPEGAHPQAFLPVVPGWWLVSYAFSEAAGRVWHLDLVDSRGDLHWRLSGAVAGVIVRPFSMARFAGGFLVACAGYEGEDGRTVGAGLLLARPEHAAEWLFRAPPDRLLAPSGLRLTDRETLTMADRELHVALEMRPDGEILWEQGRRGEPGEGIALRAPESCVKTRTGYIVVDTMNDRVVEFDRCGRIAWQHDGRGSVPSLARLRDPRDACVTPAAGLLVADSGNGRILEFDVDRRGAPRTVFGPAAPPSSLLSHPRSAMPQGQDGWLVCDTNHHRVLHLGPQGEIRSQIGDGRSGGGERLHWPRVARGARGGHVVVADGLNGRIVTVDERGRFIRDLGTVFNRALGVVHLQDPHDVRVLPNEMLLIVDSSLNAVFEVDSSGAVTWWCGLGRAPELRDPHSAIRIADGRTLIADSGNHRLLLVGGDDESSALPISRKRSTNEDKGVLRFPRAVTVGNGTILAADLDRAVYTVDRSWRCDYLAGPMYGADGLGPIRDMCLMPTGDIVIADTISHRVVRLVPPRGVYR